MVVNCFPRQHLSAAYHNTEGCHSVCGLTPQAFLFCISVFGPPFLNRFLIELIYLKGKGIVFSDKDKDFAAESVRRTGRTIIVEKTEYQKKRLSRPKISVYISSHFLDRF